MNTNFNTNLKFWSDVTNAYNAQGFETKNVADFFKNNPYTSSNGTQKKQAATVNN